MDLKVCELSRKSVVSEEGQEEAGSVVPSEKCG